MGNCTPYSNFLLFILCSVLAEVSLNIEKKLEASIQMQRICLNDNSASMSFSIVFDLSNTTLSKHPSPNQLAVIVEAVPVFDSRIER